MRRPTAVGVLCGLWTVSLAYLWSGNVIVSLIAGGIGPTTVVALPVAPPRPATKTPPHPGQSETDHRVEEELDNLGLEYGRYLQEVVQALEQDKDFAKKLENVSQEEIRSGMIAQQLDLVGHHVRNKLDELKRVELDRLRKLARKEHDLEQQLGGEESSDGRRWRTVGSKNADSNHKWTGELPEHVNVDNPHRFEVEDLHRLIQSATRDLEELDTKRKEDFKRYEMEKEHNYRESLKQMNETQKHEAEKKHDDAQQKHKNHPKIHHPGSKQQLEEVWEQQDHMQKQEFNPKVFFNMHDVNGDGFLDQEEVEALLSIEIKKIYDPEHNPEDDPNEMQEEYHRMREHIYKEADSNKDGLISKKEFLDFTQRAEFEQDNGWEGLEDKPVYNEDELKHYEEERQKLMQHYNQYYAAYPHQGYDPNQLYYPQGFHPQGMPGDVNQMGYGHPGQMHPGGGMQQHPGQGQGQGGQQGYYQYQVDPNMQHPPQQQIGYGAPQVHPGQMQQGQQQQQQQQPQGIHPQIAQQQAAQVAAAARQQQLAMQQHHQNMQQQQQPGQGQGHPGQGFIGQAPSQQGHPGQAQPQQGFIGQAPPQQGHPQGQLPPPHQQQQQQHPSQFQQPNSFNNAQQPNQNQNQQQPQQFIGQAPPSGGIQGGGRPTH